MRRLVPLAIAALVALVAVGALQRSLSAPPPTAPVESEAPVALAARGRVWPVDHARVGTISGGAVTRLAVRPGEAVAHQQEIARLLGPSGTEVLTAPFRGTVLDLRAQVGDSLPPGALVATVGNLDRLHVETTDVDEFLIRRVRTGQLVQLRVDALERDLTGVVRSRALEPRSTAAGDEHYVVIIDLSEQPPDLLPGMTVRARFVVQP